MLTVKKMGLGSEDYYLKYFARKRRVSRTLGGNPNDCDDPYFGPDNFEGPPEIPLEPAGQWLGAGSSALGLFGEVLPEELKALMRGLNPFTSEPLVQNAAAANRVPGWDLTFSDPKTVGIVWSQADEWRLKIEASRRGALLDTIRLMEDRLAFSRIGKGGYDYVRVKLVIAAFEHYTSRNEDQQPHTHVLVLNVAVDESGGTRSLFSRPLYVNRDLLGAYYRAALAARLWALGFRIKKHGPSFEIAGVPDQLVAACSTRREEILAHLHKQGRSGGTAAAVAALETRKQKSYLPPAEELLARWRERNAQYGFTNVSDILHDPKRFRRGTVDQALDAAINRLSEQHSHFTRTDFQEAALQEAPALGLHPREVLSAVTNVANGIGAISTATTATLIDLGVHEGQQRFTTKEVHDEEQQLLADARTLASRTGATVSDRLLNWAITDQMKAVQRRAKKTGNKNAQQPRLSEEQRQAVEHITQDKKNSGSIRIMQGVAGSGKTDFVLGVANRAFEDAGYRVIAITPTGKAGRVLQRDTGMDAQTVTKALGDYELPWGCVLKHHLRQLQRVALGKRPYKLEKPAPIKLGPRDVVILDEAGMMATRELGLMMAHVANSGATLILAGDAKQNPPVGRGAPFQSLATRFGSVELSNIQRQQEEWARQAATHAAKGEVKEALAILADNKSVRASETVDAAAQELLTHWRALGGDLNPANVVVLANANSQTQSLNKLLQEERLNAGILNPAHSIEIRDIDREEDRVYRNRVHVGDQVLFTMNSKSIGVENGTMGTVIAIRKLINAIAVQLPTGEVVQVPVKNYSHIRLGYALTNYKAQGDSFPHVLVLVTEAQATLPSFYVNVTRAKHSTTLYTTKSLWNPDEQPIHEAPIVQVLSRQPDLRLASDLLEAKGESSSSPPMPPLEIVNGPEEPDDAGSTEPPADAPSGMSSAASEAPKSQPSETTADKPLPANRLDSLHATVPPPNTATATLGGPSQEAANQTASDEGGQKAPGKAKRTPPPDSDNDYVWILPAGPAGRPAKRRKKRRPGDVETPWDEPMPVEGTTEPVDSDPNAVASHPVTSAPEEKEVAAGGAPLVLPDSYLSVPLPNVASWTPQQDSQRPLPDVFPPDFLQRPVLRPTARRIAGSLLPWDRKAVQPSTLPPLQTTMTPEQAAQPSMRKELSRQARERLTAEICKQFNIPPDRIEIISIEEWDETTEHHINHWVRITYRITTYGRGGLVNVADFPVFL